MSAQAVALIAVFSFLLLSASCHVNLDLGITMTEELLKAQNELNVAFEFTELYLMATAEPWVGNITMLIEEDFLPGFFDSRQMIKDIIAETEVYIDSYEANSCRNEVQRQWRRQSSVIGNRLQYCLREAHRIMKGEFNDLNLHHPNAQRLTAHTPNQSFHILSDSDIFSESGTFYRAVNRRLRQLLGRASPWLAIMDELEEDFRHHVINARKYVKMCYDNIVGGFQTNSENHKERVRNC